MNKIGPFLLPIIRNLTFIIVGLLLMFITEDSLEHLTKWWSIICVSVNVITIIILMFFLKVDGKTFKEIINSNNFGSNKYILFIIVLMILLGIGGMYIFGFLIYGSIPVTLIEPIPIWLAMSIVFLLPVTTILAEFPLYFAYSLNGIEKVTNNKLIIIGYPMFFYALQHSFIPLLIDWNHIIFRFLSFLPLLIVLGNLYYKNRRLKPIMLGHGALDLLASLNILLTSVFPFIFEMISR